MTQGMQLLVDCHHGIYVPQVFAETVNIKLFTGIKESDIKILLRGPDAKHYWDAWVCVLEGAKMLDAKGRCWHLHQDQDLWIYCLELLSETERLAFFA
jgi:hypothetical protein